MSDAIPKFAHDEKDGRVYIDEVQQMDEFVDVLNSFRHIDNADTYVTGNNSHFLSSDIPTEYRGRGETIQTCFFVYRDQVISPPWWQSAKLSSRLSYISRCNLTIIVIPYIT